MTTVVNFQASQWPCLATRLSLSLIDPVACLLVFFKGRSFSGLRVGLLALQRRNCEKSFPFAQVTVLAIVRNTFRPSPHESRQAKTGFNRLQKRKQNTLESGFKKVFLRKIKSVVGSFTRTPLESFAY